MKTNVKKTHRVLVKRVLGIVLSLMMILTLLPATAFAGTITQTTYTKVEKPEAGKQYIVVAQDGSTNNYYALTTKENVGYTNDSGYAYSGFDGVKVSLSSDTALIANTDVITTDMLWEISGTQSDFSVKHVSTGKYLSSSYASNTGVLKLAEESTTWHYSSSETSLRDDGTNHGGKKLNYDSMAVDHNGKDAITEGKGTGSADLFTVRSSGDKIYFYEKATSTVTTADSVTVSADKSSIKVGEILQMTASVLPVEANQTVEWSVAGDNATISETGLLTAKKAGSVEVAATAGSVTGKTTITIQPKATVSGPFVNQTEIKDGTEYVIVSDGYGMNADYNAGYTNSTNYSYTGLSGVKVTIADGEISAVDEDMIWVAEKTDSTLVFKNKSTGKYLSAAAKSQGGDVMLNAAGSNATWSTDGKLKIARLESSSKDYFLTWDSTSPGLFTIRSSSSAKAVSFYAKEATVEVTGITLDKAAVKLTVGDEATLAATVAPENATEKTVTWTSDNTAVATVDNGKVTAVKAGTATITAKAGSFTATCAVTVTEPAPTVVPVEKVSLNASEKTMEVGDEFRLYADVEPSDANNKAVSWTSSDDSVATVADGVVTAVKAGTATITVTTEDGNKTATCKVTVNAKTVAVTSVALNETALSLEEGADATLTATVLPADATDKAVTWASDNQAVATVVNGKVTAVEAGTAKITATAGGKTATCTVTVTAKAPTEPEKVTVNYKAVKTPKAGETYVVVADGKALANKANAGYTNEGGYKYSGLDGENVTITNNTITTVTKAIQWKVVESGANIILQNVETNKYLTASYASNTGKLGLSAAKADAQAWKYADSLMKMTANNGSSSDKHLTFDNASNHTSSDKISSGSADLFTIRSTGDTITFYGEVDGTPAPADLSKVSTPENGQKYVVVVTNGNNYALDVTPSKGYTNSDSYTYTGFKGQAVTIASNKITSSVTKDMVWTVTVNGSAILLKNEYTGEYLTAKYSENAPKGGDLATGTVGTEWKYNGTTLEAVLNNVSKAKYLAYDTDGSEKLIDIRSTGNTVAFYVVGNAEVKDPSGSETPDTPDVPTGGSNVAFTSDVHNKSDNQSADRLNGWLNTVAGKVGAIDTMGFCGDNADASASEANYWTYVQKVQDVVTSNTNAKDMFMVPGNHEWNPGNMGSNTSAARNALKQAGTKKETSAYVLYSFGATSGDQNGTGYRQGDIDALETYLQTAPTDRPIFILSHFPIHKYNSRNTKNADVLTTMLNKYATTHQIIFLWGHNHTESDTHYDKITTGSIDGTEIKFTYAAAGCMSDSEYQGSSSGSATVKGKGLVASIKGTDVTLTYYAADGSVVVSGKATVPAGNPKPQKVTTPETNKEYVVVIHDGDYYALNTAVNAGYTNSDHYGYTGFTGKTVTVSDSKITGEVSEDMVWTVKVSGSTITLQNKATGEYLDATTAANSSGGQDRKLVTSTTSKNWTLGSDNKLKAPITDADQYLAYVTDAQCGTLASGNANLFTIRSSSNADTVSFYEVGAAEITEPDEPVIVDVTGVTLSDATLSIPANSEYRLVATITPANASNTRVSWTSSNTDVAKVDAIGNVTALKQGSATITVKTDDGAFTATCALTVTAAAAPGEHTHTWNDGVITVEPTCTVAGVKTYTCTACGETKTEDIAALGHTAVTDAAVAATCIPGLTEGSHCSVCGTVIVAQEEVAPTGEHVFGDWTVTLAPTEDEKGSQFHTCEICGTREAETIPALGHKTHRFPETGDVTKAPTCTEAGEMTYTCMGCDEIKTEVIPAMGHTAVMIKGKAATCTETGLKDGYYCKVCEAVLVPQEEIPALGHSYVASGTNKKVCEDCGDVFTTDGMAQDADGLMKVYKDGEVDTTYTGFYRAGGIEYYVVNGTVDGKTTDVIKDADGMIGSKGVWYHVVNSKVAHVDTVAKNSKGWWKITDGVVEFGYNGFASNDKGDWYIENGKVTFAKDDVIKDAKGTLGKAGAWYYVKGSKVTYTNTVAKNAYGWWCIHNGVVDFTCNSVEKNDNGWWKIKNGKVDFGYTGVAKNSLGWWRIESGKVNFNFNGIAYNSNGGWLLQKGKVIFSYTGKYTWNGKSYNIVKGKVS